MNRLNLTFVLLAASLAGSICLPSIGRADDVPGVTDTEVHIGAHTSETGKGAQAAPQSKAIRAYFDDVNKAGGINGRKIKWTGIDTQSLPPKTVEAIHTLVEQEKIFAVVGAGGPSHLAVNKYLQDKGVPDLFILDYIDYLNPFARTTFQAWFSEVQEGQIQAKYIVKHFPGKRVCWVSNDAAGAKRSEEEAKKVFAAYNAKAKDGEKIIVGPAFLVDRMSTQANSEVLKLRKENCEVNMVGVYGAIVPAILNFGASQAYTPMWVSYYPNVTTQMVELVDKNVLENHYIATMPMAIEDGMGAYNFAPFREFLKNHDLPHSGTSARGYYVAELFTEALRRTGKDLTREKLVLATESLSGYKCSLCTSPISLSPSQHMPIDEPIMVGFKDGKWYMVEKLKIER